MTKLHSLIAVLLCLSCLSATAQEIVVENIEGQSVVDQFDLRDLIYAEPTASGPSKARQSPGLISGEIVNYEDRITNMPQYLHDFIGKFVEAGRTVLDGGSSWLSDPTLGVYESNNFYYLLNTVEGENIPFTFPAGSSAQAIQDAANNAIIGRINKEYDILKSFLPYAFLSLNFGHPEIFWIGNSLRFGYNYSFGYSYYTSGTGTVKFTMKLQFILHENGSGYDIRNNGVSGYDFRHTDQLAKGIQLFNSCVQNILKQCQTGSRYDKLLAAHDWLTMNNCYNLYFASGRYGQSSIGDTPWSALSALEGNNDQKAPVCEGYARAFKVLCDALEIPCILMAGNARPSSSSAGDAHMWNYVKMENGKWYAIDVTWDDPVVSYSNSAKVSGYESHNWFLLGSTTDVGGLDFIESHPEQWQDSFNNNGSIAWDLLPGPELAPLAWTPEEEEDNTGDLNGDGKTDIADAVTILNLMAEGIYSKEADLNEDNKIDIADFVTVLNIMAEK